MAFSNHIQRVHYSPIAFSSPLLPWMVYVLSFFDHRMIYTNCVLKPRTQININEMFIFFFEIVLQFPDHKHHTNLTVTKFQIDIIVLKEKKTPRKSHKNKMKQHPNKYRKVSSCKSSLRFTKQCIFNEQQALSMDIHVDIFHFYVIYQIKSIKMNNDNHKKWRTFWWPEKRSSVSLFVSSVAVYLEFVVTVHWCIVRAYKFVCLCALIVVHDAV